MSLARKERERKKEKIEQNPGYATSMGGQGTMCGCTLHLCLLTNRVYYLLAGDGTSGEKETRSKAKPRVENKRKVDKG